MLITLDKRSIKVHDTMTLASGGGNELAFSLNGVDVAVRLLGQHTVKDCLSNLTHEQVPVKVLVRVHRKEETVIVLVSTHLEGVDNLGGMSVHAEEIGNHLHDDIVLGLER